MQDGALILDRIAQALDLSSDTDIARELGVSRSTVSSWRSRGAIPIKEYIGVAKRSGLNLHWLLLGEGEPFIGSQGAGDQHVQSGSSAMEAQALADGAALARELGLDKIAMLARRGTQRGQWRILQVLAGADGGMSEGEILKARKSREGDLVEEDILADLYVLVREGLVKAEGEGSERRYCLGESTWLRAASAADKGQAWNEAVQAFIGEILPAAGEGRGGYIIGRIQTNKGKHHELMAELQRQIRQTAESATTKPEQEIVLLLGVAAKDL